MGLSHRNSVSTYRRRYPDFPAPRPAPYGGRQLLWRRADIQEWHDAWADRARPRLGPKPASRLSDLVDATVRLMLANPGTDIGIRQIAAEAGIAHSDVYRYAESKDQLLALASQRMVDTYMLEVPGTYEELLEKVDQLVKGAVERQAGMRVIGAEIIRDPNSKLAPPLPILEVARLIRERAADDGDGHVLAPEVAAGCVAAMLWGWAVLGPRFTRHLGFDAIPADELAQVVRILLAA